MTVKNNCKLIMLRMILKLTFILLGKIGFFLFVVSLVKKVLFHLKRVFYLEFLKNHGW